MTSAIMMNYSMDNMRMRYSRAADMAWCISGA